MHDFKKLKIWSEARELNKLIYKISSLFPSEEKCGLISQIRRASMSIASNIGEGSSFNSNAMFTKHLNIALGSLCEVETQLYLANDLNYIQNNEIDSLLDKVDKLKRMIISFTNNLNKN